jgi:hypothetical protein
MKKKCRHARHNGYKKFGKDKFEKKKLKGFFSWTQQIDIEVKNFFATLFDLL